MSLAHCDGGRWPLAPAATAVTSCIVRAGDNPYRHARSLSGWRREILQLSAGPFAGRVSEVAGGGCRGAVEFLSRSVFHIGTAYPGGLTLGVVDGTGGALWNGVRVGSDCVLCAFGDLEMVLRTYDNACLRWLFVPQAALAGYRALRELVDAQKHAAALCLSDRGLAERLRRCADGLPAPSMAVEIGDIAARFVHGYLAGTPLLNARASHAMRATSAVRRFFREHPGASVSILDLYAIAATSERTLRNASEAIAGESPMAFLRAMRLNQVRRCLLAATTPVRITEIGMKYGFLHMPQFSKDYRTLFGELPSETIRRQLAAAGAA